MRLSRVLKREILASGGRMTISKVPYDKQPTVDALNALEREIAAQISANEAMSNRSMLEASKLSSR